MSGKKRTKTKEPENEQGDRLSRTEGGVDILYISIIAI